jgi:hypothetical protein
VLVVQTSCIRQMSPLHAFAQREHSDDRMRILYGLAPYILGYLLLELCSPASRSTAAARSS